MQNRGAVARRSQNTPYSTRYHSRKTGRRDVEVVDDI
jgi:hypothetical protein